MWEHEGSTLGRASTSGTPTCAARACTARRTRRCISRRGSWTRTRTSRRSSIRARRCSCRSSGRTCPRRPMRVTVTLQDAWSGDVYATNTVNLTSANGSALFPMAVPEQTPSSASYAWSARMMYPTNVAGSVARAGWARTTRSATAATASPVEAETIVIVSADRRRRLRGLPRQRHPGRQRRSTRGRAARRRSTATTPAARRRKASSASCTDCSSWAGWGIFSGHGRRGHDRVPRRLPEVLAEEHRDGEDRPRTWSPARRRRSTCRRRPACGRKSSFPVSDFAGVNLSQIKGCFEITSDTATTFYVDHVRFVKGIFNVYRDAGIPAKSPPSRTGRPARPCSTRTTPTARRRKARSASCRRARCPRAGAWS